MPFFALTFSNFCATESQAEVEQTVPGEQVHYSVMAEAHCSWRGNTHADHLVQNHDQDWLSFPAEDSGKGKSLQQELCFSRPFWGAASGLQATWQGQCLPQERREVDRQLFVHVQRVTPLSLQPYCNVLLLIKERCKNIVCPLVFICSQKSICCPKCELAGSVQWWKAMWCWTKQL